jgi:putative hemolysin
MYTGLIIGICVTMLFSAYFSGMEIAFVSSNRMLAEVEKDQAGPVKRTINFFYAHSNDFVATMLVGNNIVLVIYGILIAQLFDATIFAGFDPSFTVPADTILSTIIVLFTGEFLPKTLFKSAPNRWLSLFAIPTFLVYIILWPISRFSTFLSRCLLRLVGVKVKEAAGEEEFSKVDLDYLVQTSIDNTDDKDIEPEMELFQNVLDFSDTKVRDCMIPRTEVQAVNIADCTLDSLKQKFIETGHSKLIVYKDDIDHIVGYIHSSEMFSDADNWRDHIISMPFVPESMAAQKLMQLFMQQKKSLGVVVDEFGGTGGIVALEDIVEEIFGEIEDEHDTSNLISRKVSDNEYLLSARLEIDNVNETFDLGLPEGDYMTIGGLILHYNQSFPQINEIVKINQFEFKILKKTNTKIELVRLKVTG